VPDPIMVAVIIFIVAVAVPILMIVILDETNTLSLVLETNKILPAAVFTTGSWKWAGQEQLPEPIG